jgi:hypothetical protein
MTLDLIWPEIDEINDKKCRKGLNMIIYDGKLDTGSYSAELKFLLACLDVSNTLNKEMSNLPLTFNWDYFLELCFEQEVYPIVYQKLMIVHNQTRIPEEILNSLLIHLHENGLKQLQQFAHLDLFIGELEKESIPFLLLKDPAFAVNVYSDLDQCTAKHIDLLVHPQNINNAGNVLTNQGFKLVKETNYSEVPNYEMNNRLVYIHPERNICFKIYNKIEVSLQKEISFEELWSRKQSRRVINETMYFLGKEDLFSYLTMYGSRYNWYRIRWLVDIDRFIRTEFDWKVCANVARNQNIYSLVIQTMSIANQLLKTPIPGEFQHDVNVRQLKGYSHTVSTKIRDFINLLINNSTVKSYFHR